MKRQLLHSTAISLALIVSSGLLATTASAQALEEIIVTAQKRTENVQTVPIDVAAFDGDVLQKSGASSTVDLATLVPSLTFQNTLGQVSPSLRGIGQHTLGQGVESSVAIYVDGVYRANLFEASTNFLEVEQVEVLKGPQGTLFGRNATGGVINLTTRDPGPAFNAKAYVDYANYNTPSVGFYVNAPLTDQLSMNISGQGLTQRDGWGHNLYNGNQINETDQTYSVRAKIAYRPDDATTIKLALDYLNVHNSPTLHAAEQPLGGGTLFGGGFDLGGHYDANTDEPTTVAVNTGGVALSFDHDFGRFEIFNIAAYRDSVQDIITDVDGSPANIAWATGHYTNRQYSNEFRISSAAEERIKWTLGAFYIYEYSGLEPQHFHTPPGFLPGPLAAADGFLQIGHTSGPSYAGFGQATIPVTDTTNLTLGLRYSHEPREFAGVEDFTAGPAVIPGTAFDLHHSDHSLTSRIAVDQKLGENVMGYVSFNRGYKSGGYSLNSFSDIPYAQERVDAYETGIKSDLFNRRLRLNASGYWYRYRDMQVNETNPLTGLIGTSNAGRSTIKGLEFEATGAVTERLTLSGSASWSHGRFDDYPNAPAYPHNPLLGGNTQTNLDNAAGNDLPLLARESFSLSGSYRFPLPDQSTVELAGVYFWSNGYFLEPDNLRRQGRYNTLSSTLSWTSTDERYKVSLYGRNLTDADYQVVQVSTQFVTNGGYAPPRTYGIQLQVNFK